MKTIGNFLNKKVITAPRALDEKSIFYIFDIVIREEYGKQGAENVKAIFFRDKKVFIKAAGFWENEILAKKLMLINKINQQLGSEEIRDLAMSN